MRHGFKNPEVAKDRHIETLAEVFKRAEDQVGRLEAENASLKSVIKRIKQEIEMAYK